MHNVPFLQDLAIIMVVAGLVTVLCHRFKQPVVLGSILAGLIIGPHTPPFPLVSDEHTIGILAELGVVLLMFSLGQHFSLRKLAKVGMTAVIASVLEIGLMVCIGYSIGRWFGWNAMDSLFLGALLSISSTTIIIKALGELGMVKERFAELIFGILIIEDILGIAMIALLSGIAQSGSLHAADAARTLGYLALFLTMVLVVGLLVVPRLLRFIARFQSNEMLLVATLGICFGVSLLASLMGYSVALGAFLAGAIVAEARESGRIEVLIEGVRDMFSAVFFVTIGMLIDPQLIATYWLPIVVITLAVVLGKIITCSLGTFLAGHGTRTSVRVGMGMAQIGEFSFIIAQLGLTLKVSSDFLYPVAVAVSVITTLLTPYLIKGSDGTVGLIERTAPRSLLGYLDVYQRWIGELTAPDSDMRRQAIRGIVLKLGSQVLLDLVLVAGLLVGAGMAVGQVDWLDQHLPSWSGGQRTALWVVAMVLSLPILTHAFAKMRALSVVLAEIGAESLVTREHMPRMRAAMSLALLTPAAAGTVVMLLAISAAMLPPWPVLVVLSLVFGLVLIFLWRRFSQIYSSVQHALRETLSDSHQHQKGRKHLTTLLEGASLATVQIDATSPVAGHLIRQLQLRSTTGASVVGIERNGTSIINPGPDEEILVGDRVMLLGTSQHLDQARRVMS